MRFVKIDVQGAELNVLHGAERLIDRRMIDLMWVEFSGELEILQYLHDRDYRCFDSPYLLIPRKDAPTNDKWNVVATKNPSNGKKAFVAWPHEYPRSPVAYCDWFQAVRADFIVQTDLTFVRAEFVGPFYSAAGAALGPPASR